MDIIVKRANKLKSVTSGQLCSHLNLLFQMFVTITTVLIIPLVIQYIYPQN